MIWGYPSTLWGILLVPLAVTAALVSALRARKKLGGMTRGGIEWQVRAFLRDFSMTVFFILSVLAAADPKNGRMPVTGELKGLDVAVAFDVSRSMLARDLEPSRLEKSVLSLRQIVKGLENARFSLVPFKGDARLLVPMTEDRVVLDLWMERLGPGLSTESGTDVESALKTAMETFPPGEGRNRALVIVSDGESLTGRTDGIRRELAESGIPVHVLIAGTAEGTTIPLGDGSYVKDASGRPVVSRAETEELKRLSEETGGSFHLLSRPGATAELISAIDDDRKFSESRGIRFIGRGLYRTFLIPALFFWLSYLIARIFPWRRT